MAKRKYIGLIFSYNEDWIAGAYYIMNLVYALRTLPDAQKPQLVILSTTEEELDKIREINYPYTTYKNISTGVMYDFYVRLVNKVGRMIKGHNLMEKKFKPYQIGYELTAEKYCFFGKIRQKKRIFWIPDFQEVHLPHFFSAQELLERKAYQLAISKRKSPLILSSQDAFDDFRRLYPKAKNTVSVLNFAVTHPVYHDLDIEQLKKQFGINKPYFFSPNQFWQHKNHIVILEALVLLKNRNDILVAFTGKEEDYRNPLYFSELQNFIKENGIEDKVRFLGFIDRKQQLQLMQHSIAVVQPSLFEGWSTVVEDAKAMNQFVIASDLSVHKEQLDKNVAFFDPHNPAALAAHLAHALDIGFAKELFDYNENITNFARDFVGC